MTRRELLLKAAGAPAAMALAALPGELGGAGAALGAIGARGAERGGDPWETKDAKQAKEATVIEKVEVYPIRHAVRGRFKFFEGAPGAAPGRYAALVKVSAAGGAAGWGESVPSQRWSYETIESVVTALRRYLAPVLLGRDPRDIAGAHAAMDAAIAASFSKGMPIAKAGVDLALHDLAGKLEGKPTAELWGRRAGGKVTLSWTLNPKALDDVDALIDEGWRRGYRNFNVKVAPDLDFDLALCRRVKERVPQGFLWADANGGYDLETALAAAPKLAGVGVAVLEQPLPSNRIEGYRRLKRQGALPIILDEGVVAPEDLLEFHRLGMMDGVALKHARTGGLLGARREVEVLKQEGLLFLGSGLTDPDVSLAAALILYAAYGLEKPAALNGPQFLEGSVLRAPFEPVDGILEAPRGPGLGVEVDEARVAALAVDLGRV
ncbi:MAG: mandelate racemase [Planctomycetes bacterium]|nr:mandelate racemase [Planctomycetota bacterium]